MKLACVILAAGAGRRMGLRNKALLRWQGQTFLERICESARSVGVEEFVVVVGEPHAAETVQAAEELGLPCAENPSPETGMASSVAIGFRYASRSFESQACWLWPVDSPGIDVATLSEVARHANANTIVTPRFGNRGGHPTLVGRNIWLELAHCESESEGARSVFRREPSRRKFLDFEDAAIRHDVDRPEDLETLSC